MANPKSTVHTIDVGWGHCDPAGIVFYPNFYQWFDEATHHILDECGMGHLRLRTRFKIIGCGLIDTGATFKYPARYGDQLEITSWLSAMSNRTFTVEHHIHSGETEVCSGFEVRGCFVNDPAELSGIAAIPIPDELRTALGT